MRLFNAQGANATGTAVAIQSIKKVANAIVAVWGTFGGGTVVVEQSFDAGVTFVPMTTAVSLTAPGSVWVKIAPGSQVRARLTGATAPTISAELAF